MVRNIKGGNSHKKMASKKFVRHFNQNNVPFPDENKKQFLGKVIAPKGDRRFSFNLFKNNILDTTEYIFRLPGGERKRIYTDTIILVGERDFQENVYDCIYVYDDKREISLLSTKNYLPNSYHIEENLDNTNEKKTKLNINEYMPSDDSCDTVFNPNRFNYDETNDQINEINEIDEVDDKVNITISYKNNKKNLTKVRNYLYEQKNMNLQSSDDLEPINIDDI